MDKLKKDEIFDLLQKERASEALEMFENIVPENTIDYWLIKGKIEQKFQKWSGALNAFQKVIELDETNCEAQNNIRIIQNILNFWNPEMFNP